MIQPDTLLFLKQLKKNNTKEWFDANRAKYEEAKKNYMVFIQSIIDRLGKTDQSVCSLQAKDCTFRINRDIRFSKDKTPYKTHMDVFIGAGGKKSTMAGYFVRIAPEGSMAGGGLWMPAPDILKKVRQEIDYCFDDFSKIIKSKKFTSYYNDLEKNEETSLSRPPKGYDESNPAIEYIKLKNFGAVNSFTDEEITGKDVVKIVVASLEAVSPLLRFFNRAIK